MYYVMYACAYLLPCYSPSVTSRILVAFIFFFTRTCSSYHVFAVEGGKLEYRNEYSKDKCSGNCKFGCRIKESVYHLFSYWPFEFQSCTIVIYFEEKKTFCYFFQKSIFRYQKILWKTSKVCLPHRFFFAPWGFFLSQRIYCCFWKKNFFRKKVFFVFFPKTIF